MSPAKGKLTCWLGTLSRPRLDLVEASAAARLTPWQNERAIVLIHSQVPRGGKNLSLLRSFGLCRYQLSLGATNDQAELCISSGERFVVSNSTTGPSLIDNRREASCLL